MKLDKMPIMVFPNMAESMGLNDSLIYYSIKYEGLRGKELEKRYSFLSEQTIKRITGNLIKAGWIGSDEIE